MTSLYRTILKKAWFITRKFKYLWPLGLFAAFLGNSSEYQILFKQSRNITNQADTLSVWQANLNFFLPKADFTGEEIFFALFTFLIFLVIFILLIWLAISSLGGLIDGCVKANNNERTKFSALLKIGSKKFWPIFGLNIIAKAIVYGLLILILTPLMVATFAQGNAALNLFIVLLTLVIFVPATIIVSLVTKFGSAEVMLKNEKTWPAFKNGWRMFAANWLVSLEMAFVIFIINMIVGLAFVVLSIILFSPFFFFGVIYSAITPTAFNILMYISLSLLIVVSAVVGMILATFQISSWTLLYLRLSSGTKAYSKIVRWVAAFPEKFRKKDV